MNGKFEMTDDEFDELSLETQLGALFRQAQKNYTLLETIIAQCHCRQKECAEQYLAIEDGLRIKNDTMKEIADLKSKVRTKSVIEKSIITGIAAVAGFLSSMLARFTL